MVRIAARSIRRKYTAYISIIVLMLTPSVCFAQASVHTLAGVNAQTGTTYTIQAVDQTKLLTFNNASPVAVTLPNALGANFGAGALFAVRNLGVGAVTITVVAPSLIDNAATLVLTQGQGADIYSDGTNYTSQKGAGASSLSGMTSAQVPIAATATTVASSKPVQGAADTGILGSGTVAGISSPLCTDANGGATTVGCPSGGGSPGGAPVQAQFNNSGAFGGSTCFNLTAFPTGPANLDCDTHATGPNPYIDIMRFGARPVALAPFTTASCTSGSNQVTVGTIGNGPFLVGDYVTIIGCGAANTVATPSAPTVVSGASAMQTVPDAIIKTFTGANSFSYLLVSRDVNGGLTAASTATTITNGVTLGQQTVAVSSVTSTGTTLTISLGANGPPNGTLFHLTYIAQGGSQTTHKFDGYYNVCTGGGTTSITVCNMPFFSNTTDATGASIIWFNGNQVSWANQTGAYQQLICGKRPGDVAFHFIGTSIPSSGGVGPFTVWTDWGATLTPAITWMSGLGDGICSLASSRADYMDGFKITACTSSCGNGSTWTLNGNASSTVASGANVVQDSAPAITAAFSYASSVFSNGPITIPCLTGTSGNFYFQFTSPLFLNSSANWIDQCGAVNISESIDLGSSFPVSWIGRAPSELNSIPVKIQYSAFPALNDAAVVKNINFNSVAGSDQTLAVLENTNQISNGNETVVMDENKFNAAGFTSIGIMAIGVFPYGVLSNTYWSLGPGNAPANYDTTWTPALYLDSEAELYVNRVIGFGRGSYLNNTTTAGASTLNLSSYYIQGAIMPLLGVYGKTGTATDIDFYSAVSDTSPQSIIGFQADPSAGTQFVIRYRDIAGLPANVISGWAPSSIYDFNTFANSNNNQFLNSVMPDLSGFGKVALSSGSVSDNFNRANGALTSPWVQSLGGVNISNSQATGTVSGNNIAYYASLIPNSYPNPTTGGEFCSVTLSSFLSGEGCVIYDSGGLQGVQSSVPGYNCLTNGSIIQINQGNTQIGSASYVGNVGDRLYFQGIVQSNGTNALTCSVYPVNGTAPTTATAAGTGSPAFGYPGVIIFDNAGTIGSVDNFMGGSINPAIQPNTETTYNAPQHFISGTVGSTTPIVGALPSGYWSSSTMQASNWISANGLNSAYDGFNRANGALGSNWTTVTGLSGLTITGNQVVGGTTNVHQAAAYTGSAFSNDQFSEATLPVGGNNVGGAEQVTCRNTPASGNFYGFQFYNGNFSFNKFTAGVAGALGTPVAGTVLAGDVMRIECIGTPTVVITGFQISGGVKTQIAQVTDTSFPTGSPGIDIFGNAATSVMDNWNGGNLNTLEQPTIEMDVLGNRHILNALTIGSTVPNAGALGPGVYNTLWSPSSSICTDTNSKLVTTGCAGGSLSGMTAGQVAIAGSASTITSSKPLQGTDTNVLTSSTVAAGTGNPLCTDTGSGATTTSCPNLSGMTSGQVAIAGSAITVTSSKALQGTDTSVLSSGTVSGTGATLCTDANGGATTVGCTGGSISGLTAGQIPVAGTATTITSSKPQQGTDANILTSGTISATTPALLCTDANSGATTSNCSVYNTQSAATNTNIAATNMVASAPANTMYMYMWTISLTTVGTGCTSTTSVILNLIFTDPSAAGSVTESLGQISIAPGGNGTLGFVAQGNDTVYAKSATAVQYSTSGYTPGTGCTVNPSYQVTMRLIPIS